MKKENNRRRFPGESSRNRVDRAAERREQANVRQAQSDSLTPQQKIEKLDMRFGAGVGAKKERAKIALRMNKQEARIAQNADVQLDKQQLPDEIMQEIAALNEETGKKKVKAKDRRARDQKNN